MTASTPIRRQSLSSSAPRTVFTYINLTIAGGCLLLVVAYIIFANGSAASAWQQTQLQSNLSALMSTNSDLDTDVAVGTTSNDAAAAAYAQAHGMVIASNVSYIVQKGAVALNQ